MLSRKVMAASAAALIAGATLLQAGEADARPRYYYGHGYHHGGWNRGGAAAAGIVGGLALGALAAGAYNQPYYSSPGYTYAPAPVYGAYGGYGGCYITRETVYDDWGRPHWRRVRVCD